MKIFPLLSLFFCQLSKWEDSFQSWHPWNETKLIFKYRLLAKSLFHYFLPYRIYQRGTYLRYAWFALQPHQSIRRNTLCLNIFNFYHIAIITSQLESSILTRLENAKTKSSALFFVALNYKWVQVTYCTPGPKYIQFSLT